MTGAVGGWRVSVRVYTWQARVMGEGWWVEGEGEGVYLASQALACAGDGCFLPLCAYAMLRRYSKSGPMFCLRMRFLSSRLHSVKITQIM